MKKQVLSIALVLAMLACMLTGCSGGAQQTEATTAAPAAAETKAAETEAAKTEAAETEAPAAGEPITLSVACNVDIQEAFDAFFAGFEETHPDIKIDFVQFGAAEELAFLQSRIASNTMPDVFGITAGSFGKQLAEDGTLYDLTGSAAADRLVDGALESFKSPSGKIYGITYGLSSTCLFYNQEIFDELGLTAPANWDELMDTCEKVKAAGYIPLSIATDASIGNTFFSYGFGNNMAGKDWKASMADGSFDLNIPEVADVFAKYKECGDKGYFQDGFVSADYASSNELFIQGQAAMLFAGSWFSGSLMDADFTVKTCVPPMNAAGAPQATVVSTETGWAVNAKSANLDAAMELMDYFTGEGYAILQNTRQNVPALKDASTAVVNYIVADFLPYFGSAEISVPLYFEYLPAAFQTDLSKYFQEVGSGSITPEEAAAKCADLYKDAF